LRIFCRCSRIIFISECSIFLLFLFTLIASLTLKVLLSENEGIVFHTARAPEHVASILKITWGPVLAALSTALEQTEVSTISFVSFHPLSLSLTLIRTPPLLQFVSTASNTPSGCCHFLTTRLSGTRLSRASSICQTPQTAATLRSSPSRRSRPSSSSRTQTATSWAAPGSRSRDLAAPP
jgi:hypothetical protein